MRAPPHPDAGQPDPEDPVRTGEPGSGDRALKTLELVAQGEILEGDGHRPERQGSEERPETAVGRNNSIRSSGRMVIHMMQAPKHRLPDDPARRVGRGRRS
jgi:hypothetical protein